jgi:3-hydroxyisobutyrate dehydrogenase-like beta-hydroxyacid dehydrogenase
MRLTLSARLTGDEGVVFAQRGGGVRPEFRDCRLDVGEQALVPHGPARVSIIRILSRVTTSTDRGGGVPAPDRKRVGFIGLGHMGSPMARQLVDAGYEVTVWSRTAAHVDDLAAYGATRADSPADAIATGHLFSMLANENVLRAVLPAGLLRAAPPGFIHVNHATISASAANEFAADAADGGYGYVAAPVIGRPNVAAAGALTILAAGAPEAVDASMPMLEVMGRRVWRYGDVASAASMAKISVNYLIAHALQALAESITLLERGGLDTGQFVQMINDSVFPGPVYGGYGDAIARGSYTPPGFTTVLGLKDVMLAVDAAADAGVNLPTAPILKEIFETTVSEIGEDLDWAAIAEITRRA